MQTRFLKLLLGFTLIYIVGIIGMFNFKPLFNSNTCGEIKIVFEQKGNIPLQEVRKWMGNLSHVQENKINVYRQENFIEVIIPYEKGNRLERLVLNKNIAHAGMPIQMIHSELKLFSMNVTTKLFMFGVLLMFLGGGIYFIAQSLSPNPFQNQVLER